jgi:hypothetical protein
VLRNFLAELKINMVAIKSFLLRLKGEKLRRAISISCKIFLGFQRNGRI